jgi:hypothetical protein
MVAGTVVHFQRVMMMDFDQAAKAMRDEEMATEMEEASISPPTAACGSMGSAWRTGRASTVQRAVAIPRLPAIPSK